MADFHQEHWFLKDLQYTYLDDGFKLVAITDVPCHLFCRMTTTPPRKHALPTYRRGLRLTGDIRFCFVVYEDNEQAEAGDTLTHTWYKSAWPICETRWFYFVGTINGAPVPSESPIFKFHFPAPPPTPPPPIRKIFDGSLDDRTLRADDDIYAFAHDNPVGTILPYHNPPLMVLPAGDHLVALYRFDRAFLSFDTSSIPVTAIIQKVILYIYVQAKYLYNETVYKAICITQGVQHYPILTSDFGDQLPYTTIGGQKDIDAMYVGMYNPIELDPVGYPWVKPGGITKICIRSEREILNIPSATAQRIINFHSTQKGVGFRPQLYVDYYPA